MAEGRYDLIVNMDGQRTRPQGLNLTPEIVWPINDSHDLPDLEKLWALANMIATFLKTPAKPRVLVHCAAGINRSALVCAAVVMVLRDCNGRTATRIVRRGRRGALANTYFAAFLAGHGRPVKRRRSTKTVGIYWPAPEKGATK